MYELGNDAYCLNNKDGEWTTITWTYPFAKSNT